MSLLKLLDLVEHARRENPGMRGSDFMPRGGPSPARRLVEMMLRGLYSLRRAGAAGRADRRRRRRAPTAPSARPKIDRLIRLIRLILACS